MSQTAGAQTARRGSSRVKGAEMSGGSASGGMRTQVKGGAAGVMTVMEARGVHPTVQMAIVSPGEGHLALTARIAEIAAEPAHPACMVLPATIVAHICGKAKASHSWKPREAPGC
jgi:hypothetical protein